MYKKRYEEEQKRLCRCRDEIDEMSEYGKNEMFGDMYFALERAVSKAMDLIEAHDDQAALNVLEAGSREAEEIYISYPEVFEREKIVTDTGL